MNFNILKGESFTESVIRLLNTTGVNKKDVYEILLGKNLSIGEVEKRAYLAKDIQNAINRNIDTNFVSRRQSYNTNNVLVIGDIHAPFTLGGYLEFCIEMYHKWNCNEVIFIGDILDNHISSFHDGDPDGMGAGMELDKAKEIINKFYIAFPNAKVCIGNHDAIPNRKAFANGLSKRWIKSINEVIDTPKWEYGESFIVDGIEYCHGTGRVANARMKEDNISIVQGHYHSKSYIEFWQGKNGIRNFAMQIGCGIELGSYAFAYGKNFARPHINVGIIINGKLPIIEYMD